MALPSRGGTAASVSATRRLHSLFYGRRRLLQPHIDIAIGRRLIEMSGVDLGHLVESEAASHEQRPNRVPEKQTADPKVRRR